MVTGDRDRHFIRDRRDVEVTVYDDDLDVAVVLGRDREVCFRQAHVVVADVGTLRGILAFRVQRDRDRLLADVSGVTRHGLLCRVVHLAVVVTGDRDRHFIRVRRDVERAGDSGNNIIGRNSRRVRVSLIGLTVDVRTDGQRIADRIADCRLVGSKRAGQRIGAGQRRSVIFLAVRLCRDRQRQSVVDFDDVAFGLDRDRLRGVIVIDRQNLLLIEQFCRCRELRTKLGLTLIRCKRRLLTEEIMFDHDRVAVDRPHRIKGGLRVDGELVGEVRFVRIRHSRAARFGRPTEERMSFILELIRIQALFHIVGERLIFHRAGRVFRVLVKVHDVLDRLELNIQLCVGVLHREGTAVCQRDRRIVFRIIRMMRERLRDRISRNDHLIAVDRGDIDGHYVINRRVEVCDVAFRRRNQRSAGSRERYRRTRSVLMIRSVEIRLEEDLLRRFDIDIMVIPFVYIIRTEIQRCRAVFIGGDDLVAPALRSEVTVIGAVGRSDLAVDLADDLDPITFVVIDARAEFQRIILRLRQLLRFAGREVDDPVFDLDPVRIERHRFGHFVGFEVPLDSAFWLGIPTDKLPQIRLPVDGLADRIGRRFCDLACIIRTLIRGLILRGRIFIVQVELYKQLLPDRVKRNLTVLFIGQIADFLLIRIGRRRCVRVGAPTEELIARAREPVLIQGLRHIVDELLIVHRAGRIVRVLIKDHGVMIRLPDCVQVVVAAVRIQLLFIRRDLRTFIITIAVPGQEQRSSFGPKRGVVLVPALEIVAGTRMHVICAGAEYRDIDRLVDLDRFVRAVRSGQRFIQRSTVSADVFLTVAVAVPPDERVGRLLQVGKDRFELDQIVHFKRFRRNTRDLRIFRVDRERRSRKDDLARFCPGSFGVFYLIGTVPLQNDPVRELLALRDLGRRGLRGNKRLVDIGVAVLHIGVLDTVRIDILDADTFRAFEHLSPLTVNVKALIDPETVRVLADRIADAVDAVRLGGGVHIIVRRPDVGIVQNVAGRIEGLCEIRVEEPADELIPVARAGRRADRAAVVDTEAHDLIVGTPVQRRIRRRYVRMHEHTDLRAVPLGVDRDAVDRHGVEGILRGARFVDVPAREGVALLGGFETGVSARIERIVVEFGDIL